MGLIRTGITETKRIGNKTVGARRCDVVKKCVTFISWLLTCGCTPSPDTLLSAPLNVTIREIEVNSAVVTWEILEGDPVIGFAVTQQVPPSAGWLHAEGL